MNSLRAFGSTLNKQGNPNPLIEDFIKHAKAVSYVLQAKTMRELLSFMQVAFKQIFKCFKVNFLFQDKETIELLVKEGAIFR